MKSKFIIIAYLIAIVSFAILATSCGTKKKVVSKIKEKTEIDSSATTSENISKVEKSAEKSETKTNEETDFLTVEFEGIAGDSLHIIKRDENGKVKESITYTGKGKVTSTKGTVKSDTIINKINEKTLKAEKQLTSSTSIERDVDMSELNKMKDIDNNNWILWLILSIGVLYGFWRLFN